MVIDAQSQKGVLGSKAKVFISYSRKDIEFADRLDTALKARGFEPLIDRTDIYAFEEWWKRVEDLIARADTVVFVLSPDAVRADSVARKEVAFAASLNKRFAPIIFRPVEDKSVPEELSKLNFIFFDDPERFEASIDQLVNALQTDIGWIRQHTEYGEAERRWSAAGSPRGLLLHSPTLEVAEHWMLSRPHGAPPPTSEIQAFIATSRRGADATHRLRRLVMGAMFTLLVSIILGLVGWMNQTYIAAQWRWWIITRPYAAAQIWPYVLSELNERGLKAGDTFKECARDCPEMIVVPAGSFMMGSDEQFEQFSRPQHKVTLARPFAISKYAVTFAEWDACVSGGGCWSYKPWDAGWGRGRQPVINVDFGDAKQYVAWLSQGTGKAYRLLSESEHEYAARAGTATRLPWGDHIKPNGLAMANCMDCGSEWDYRQTAPVGSFAPNKFGLYDMVGNVYTWTEDCVHLNYNRAPDDGSAWTWTNDGDCSSRISRGGCWRDRWGSLMLYVRNTEAEDYRGSCVGFRVVRTLLVTP